MKATHHVRPQTLTVGEDELGRAALYGQRRILLEKDIPRQAQPLRNIIQTDIVRGPEVYTNIIIIHITFMVTIKVYRKILIPHFWKKKKKKKKKKKSVVNRASLRLLLRYTCISNSLKMSSSKFILTNQ